jgi:hypothetical protein
MLFDQGDGPAKRGVGGGARVFDLGSSFLSPALTPGLNWRSFRRSVDVRTAVWGMSDLGCRVSDLGLKRPSLEERR